MSRRVLGVVVGAALTVGVGAVLLPAGAAAACLSWTDAKGDSKWHDPTGAQSEPTGESKDDNMDIVAATFGTVGADVVATVKVASLATSHSDGGDEYAIYFTMGGKNLLMYTDRDVFSETTKTHNRGIGFYNITDDKVVSGGAVTYDTTTELVTFKHTLAKLTEALGKDAAGLEISKVEAVSINQVRGITMVPYDFAPVAGTTSFPCTAAGGGGTPTPTPTATTSPSPSPSPTASPTPTGAPVAGFPRPGCGQIQDAKGDGKPLLLNTVAGPVEGQNDPDLDILSVAFETTATHLVAYIKVDKLAAKPAVGPGHAFDVSFKIGDRNYNLYTGHYDGQGNAVRDAMAPTPLIPRTGGRTSTGTAATAYNATLKVTSEFNIPQSTVIIRVERAGVETVQAAPVPAGTELTATMARSNIGIITGTNLADVAQDSVVEKRVYKLGDNSCFTVPSKLVNVGATSGQFGDPAAVAAKLTDEAGAALSGKTVTFTLGGKSASATTGTDGVARTSVAHTLTAGSSTVAVAFTGAPGYEGSTLSVPFTVRPEATKLTFAVAKSGTSRTVTATLKDDDAKAVRGQRVTWYVNGRKVATTTTDTNGRTVYKGAKAGQTVVAEFAAVAGRYSGSKVTTRV